MSSQSNSTNNHGITFGGALALLLIALKLIGVINWPWVWVLSPIWIGLVIGVVAIVVLFIIGWRNR